MRFEHLYAFFHCTSGHQHFWHERLASAEPFADHLHGGEAAMLEALAGKLALSGITARLADGSLSLRVDAVDPAGATPD